MKRIVVDAIGSADAGYRARAERYIARAVGEDGNDLRAAVRGPVMVSFGRE